MANLFHFLLPFTIFVFQSANVAFAEESTNYTLLDTALDLLNTMVSLNGRCQKAFETHGEEFFFKNVLIKSSAFDHGQKLREIMGNLRKYAALAPRLMPQWKEAKQQLMEWEGAESGGGHENPAKVALQSANALIGEWKSMRFKGQYRDEMEEELDAFSRGENDGEKIKSVLELAFDIYKITYDVFRKAENVEIMKITLPSGYINIGANLDKRLGQINGLIRELAKETAKNFKEINLTDLRKRKSSKALEEIKQSQTGQRLSNEYKNLLLWKKMLEACHKMWEKIKKLHRTLEKKELNYFQMTSETEAGRIAAEIVKVKRFIINEINGDSFFDWQEELDGIAEGKKWESSGTSKVKYEDDEDMHYFIKHAKEMISSDLAKLYWIYDRMRTDFALDWLLEEYNNSTGEKDEYYELPMTTEERIIDLLKIAANYNLQNRRSHSQDPHRKLNLTRSNSESMLHILQKDPSISRKRNKSGRRGKSRSGGRRSGVKESEKKVATENENANQNSENKIKNSEERQIVQEEVKGESKSDDVRQSTTPQIQRVRIINARQSHRRRSKSGGRKRSSDRQTQKLDTMSIRKEMRNKIATPTETRESPAAVSDPQPSAQKTDSDKETRHREEERRRPSRHRHRSGRHREADDAANAQRSRRRSGSRERRESERRNRHRSVDRRRQNRGEGDERGRRNSQVRKSSGRNDRPKERNSHGRDGSTTRRRSHRKYENVEDQRVERKRNSDGRRNDDRGERKSGGGRDDDKDERRRRKSGRKYEREEGKSAGRRRGDGNERKSGDGRRNRIVRKSGGGGGHRGDDDRRERKSGVSRNDGKRKSGVRRNEERRERKSGRRRNEDRREQKSGGRHHRDGRRGESGGRHHRH